MENLFIRTFFSALICLMTIPLIAQQIRFNEVVSSNSTFFDEDGDTPDWFELHNRGSSGVSLNGWTVTDQFDEPDKWTFPDLTLEPNAYLLLWASDKDRLNLGFPRTLISQGDEFRYITPTQSVSAQWTSLGFDDSSWTLGPTGIGYGDGDDTTTVPLGTRAIFMRKKFSISNIDAIQELILDIDYDDAFVAYINGVEMARANVNGNFPPFNAIPSTDHEAQIYLNGAPDRFVLSDPAALLQPGENVLSIQVHNLSSASSDLTIIPFLTAVYSAPTTEGNLPPALLQLDNRGLHTNFKISSGGETLYLFDGGSSLVDSILIENIPHNVSLGIPVGDSIFVYYDTPTPGLPNDGMGYEGINAAEIVFSHQGGLVDAMLLTLSGVSGPDTIRYTLDATIPDQNSLIYTSPISIDTNTVIRARVFREAYIPSRTQSRTYVLDASHDLPIISLITEPDNFFDSDAGIYVLGDGYTGDFPYFGSNIWEDWERPIHFTLYESDGSLGTLFDGGTKIFGGWSRGHAQRSLSIFARNQYGFGEINYPLFPNQDYSSYQALVLRNSGNDWLNTMLRDGALTSLLSGTGLDYQAYRPVVTYLNGKYWGFYNMREKVNEHFLASKHNLDPDNLDLLEFAGETIHGDNQDYLDLIDFVAINNLALDDKYQHVAERIDVENYIIYQVAQIYYDNTDWPGNNIKFWKPKDGKWKWILFDTDFSFGTWDNLGYQNNTLAFALEPNGPGWPNPAWSTLLFRKLTQNITFRNAFVNRFADELNSRFLPDRVCEHIDTLTAVISSEINAHYARWGGDIQYWNNQIAGMKNFSSLRPSRVKQHILSEFNLPAYHLLTIENEDPSQGYVKVNRLTIKESDWSGDYFEEVPVRVIAIAEPGYSFSHWSGGSISTNDEIEVNLTTATTLIPHFTAGEEMKIVINEINYNSSNDFDTKDWIELYNPNSGYMDLSNWELKDNDDEHSFMFPQGTLIPGGNYLVLARDLQAFKSFYPNMENVIGDFDFGLSSQDDMVRLYNHDGLLQDSVNYLSTAPWPEGANGTGASIELIHPSLDNSLPENWATFHEFGSPGRSNIIDSIFDLNGDNIGNLKYFPNPFTDQVNITFRLKRSTKMKILLYDMKGAMVQPIYEGKLDLGEYHIEAKLGFLSKGVYLLTFTDGDNNSTTVKWVKG